MPILPSIFDQYSAPLYLAEIGGFMKKIFLLATAMALFFKTALASTANNSFPHCEQNKKLFEIVSSITLQKLESLADQNRMLKINNVLMPLDSFSLNTSLESFYWCQVERSYYKVSLLYQNDTDDAFCDFNIFIDFDLTSWEIANNRCTIIRSGFSIGN